MIQFVQEADLPKLSQTSLFQKFNDSSQIAKSIADEIASAKEHIVKPADIPEIVSLIRLNGDAIAKKAIEAFQNNELNIIFNKETSKIPTALPYIVVTKGNDTRAIVFADRGEHHESHTLHRALLIIDGLSTSLGCEKRLEDMFQQGLIGQHILDGHLRVVQLTRSHHLHSRRDLSSRID